MAEPPAPERPPRRWPRLVRRAGLALALGVAGWLVLVIHPQPLFAYELRRANVVLHARMPLDPQGGPLVDEVVRRVGRSPLYEPSRTHHVFLCDTSSLFAFFEPWQRNVGGIAQWHLGGNVFIRPFNLQRGTVIGPAGKEKTGERTLAYFIAHEVAHAMTADRVGRWHYARLAAFQVEGYADYLALDHRVDFEAGRAALARDDDEMSPQRSGLYRRYELLVAWLLERRGMTVDDLFAGPLDPHSIEHELLTANTGQATGR
jgi:hypothetical protein